MNKMVATFVTPRGGLRRNRTLCAAVLAGFAVTLVVSTPTEAEIVKGDLVVDLELVASGLGSPVGLTHAGDGSGRLFVIDQAGLIRIIDRNGVLLPTPFLDLTSEIPVLNAGFDERGVLGLAFHPDYASNGRFFVRYSVPRTGDASEPCFGTSRDCHEEVLAEFGVSINPDVADPSGTILFRIDEPQWNHDAGTVAFGPDGFLYFSLGDGGGAHDGLADVPPSHGPGGNGQNIETALGAMLRIDVDSGSPYAIPPDNPFVGTTGLDEIYAYGLRNPYRFSFDDGPGGDGRLLVADVGQNLFEELDVVVKGGNYGWVLREGAHCFDPLDPLNPPASCDSNGLIDPIAEYTHTEGGTAVVGGYVYRGSALPSLEGTYIFGDFSADFGPTGRLYYLRESSPGAFEILRLQLGFDDHPLGRLLKGFGEDEDGELYALVSLELGPGGSTGEVLRLVPAGGLTFADVTASAGVGLAGELNESVAWGDYDNDGDQDLYLTLNGMNHLYRNDGGGAFTDVTTVAGVGHTGFSVGTAFGDFDNDGNLDLYVVNFGSGTDVLYRNDGPAERGGQYVFTDVTVSAGTTIERSSRGMALLDYDRDGLLDIYVMAIGENILYHNLGGLQFVDVASALGVNAAHTGVGVVCTDVDNNGWIDIYTGNRSGAISSLYMNDGGVFTDMALSAGLSAAGLGMGVLSFDYDNDLDFDLYWTTWPGAGPVLNALYENLGPASFANVTAASGTADTNGWGISCNAGDIDNDGFQDFFVTNGFSAGSTPNVLFQNQGDGTFLDATSAIGGAAFDGRGVAFADFDNDGDLDLVLTTDAEEETHLWRNDSNNGNHWITLNLVGTVSNRSAIGARVEVTTPLMTTVQEVSGGAGRGSFNSLPLEFGLGGAVTIDEVRIRWPSGRDQTIQGIAVDQIKTIREPPPGDFNEDGFVDLEDYAAFEACMSGPDVSVNTVNVNTQDVSVGPGVVFTPADVTIEIGDTVHWSWNGGLHNVESGVGSVHDGNFRSGDPTSSLIATFDVTFDASFLTANPMPDDVYPYYCIVHEAIFDMTGSVTVLANPCSFFDVDLDGDVDLEDFAAFQEFFGL